MRRPALRQLRCSKERRKIGWRATEAPFKHSSEVARAHGLKSYPIQDDPETELIPKQDDPENGRIGVGKPLGNAHQNAAWLL